MHPSFSRILIAVCLVLLAGCSTPVAPATAPAPVITQVSTPTTASTQAPAPAPSPTVAPIEHLDATVLYPRTDSGIEMGQSVRFIARVTNAQGKGVGNANVVFTINDANGKSLASLPAAPYTEDTYRTDAWVVPHKTAEGTWHTDVQVKTDNGAGSGSGAFPVKGSTSDMFLEKYGFWIDAPTMKGILPQLFAERGDARNGMIRWGGQIPGQHVLAEAIIEIQWREGNYSLDNAGAVRHFMLADLGDLGFTPVRELGPFDPMQFKQWKGWRVGARGMVAQDQIQWVIFYAPEVNKTYAIATTVVLPPAGGDPHAALRDSFTLYSDVHPTGVAPEPLPKLEQAPDLVSPLLGTRIVGVSQPIVLRWMPNKPLAQNEYYEVTVDYNYREANPSETFATRDTQITLPESLYHTPNCHVFNWQVRVMRQTGTDANGQPTSTPISYNSLYWYIIWSYPPDQPEPFPMMCPNAQY